MTIGSDALANYKGMNKNFDKDFPMLDNKIDSFCRQSYKGGFTYLDEDYINSEDGPGIVLDVNSLYPSVMRNSILPYENPIPFTGKYKIESSYPLYIQMFTCTFKLKEGMIPTLQIKNSLYFLPNEYVRESDDVITLVLTNVDLELFLEHYDVDIIEWIGGYEFKGKKGLFDDYIDKWTKSKIESKKNGNKGMYQISKLMLNSLYGKFGLNPNSRRKIPYLEDGIIKYKITEEEQRDSIYIPIASFITSYARHKTIETSQKIKDYSTKKYNKNYYIYSDTDSIHCLLDVEQDSEGNYHLTEKDKELEQLIEIDDYKLGAWKIESRFSRGKWLRQKCYIEEDYYTKDIKVTIAGLPKRLGKLINFGNFEEGFSTAQFTDEKLKEMLEEETRKLTFKHVKGGVILENIDFTIK